MPSTGHTEPPDDREQPPCDCGGCREFRAITSEPRREWYPPVVAAVPRKSTARWGRGNTRRAS